MGNILPATLKFQPLANLSRGVSYPKQLSAPDGTQV